MKYKQEMASEPLEINCSRHECVGVGVGVWGCGCVGVWGCVGVVDLIKLIAQRVSLSKAGECVWCYVPQTREEEARTLNPHITLSFFPLPSPLYIWTVLS